MNAPFRKIEDTGSGISPAPIRQLSAAEANRIAAGEVVERPAAAVKELAENALDAGALSIAVAIAGGGLSLIRVADNGHGIPRADLPLALARHATSKLPSGDLVNITFYGFRGEALPSLGAVGRLTVTSRARGAAGAAEITVDAGRPGPVRPAAWPGGTRVELRGLFQATPARLKFMRSERAENQAIADVLRRLALTAPDVAFSLHEEGSGPPRELLHAPAVTGDFFEARRARIRQILGEDFVANALPLNVERDGLRLTGMAGLPAASRGAAVAQFLYVNNRPVRDRLLAGSLRAAYADLLARDRHAAAVLFIDCAPEFVDVNVHPAKTEVRFRDPGLVRSLIVSGLRQTLAAAVVPEVPALGVGMLARFRSEGAALHNTGFAEASQTFAGIAPSARNEPASLPEAQNHPLGAARAQVHENYIISQTRDGLVITDQHAAHERLVYERLKAQYGAGNGARQVLLLPVVADLPGDTRDALLEARDDLARCGIVLEGFGPGAVALTEVPAMLGQADWAAILGDMADELLGEGNQIEGRIHAVLGRIACHGSVRSGRRLSGPEMDALLREMEATPNSGQCIHGRPTFITLPLSDIEKLFGRS